MPTWTREQIEKWRHGDPAILPDGVYSVEIKGQPTVGFVVERGSVQYCAKALRDWMTKRPEQVVRVAQLVTGPVNFDCGGYKP